MSKSNHSTRRAPKKPRSPEAFAALFFCKGGEMRDRRERRSKDARRQRETFDY